jgi:hypothetical protein
MAAKSGENGSVLPENLMDGVQGILESGQDVLKAKAASTVLESVIGADRRNGLPEGIGDLLKGSTEMMKGANEVSMTAIKTMLETMGSGKGSSETWQQLAMLLLTAFLQQKESPKSDASTETMKMLLEIQNQNFKTIMEMMQKHHEEEVEHLKASSGASPLDQQVHGQLLPTLMSRAIEGIVNPPKTADKVKELAETMNVLREITHLTGSGDGELTPAKLQMLGLQKEILSIEKEHEREMEKLRQKGEAPKAWGETLGKAAEYAQNVLGGLGFAPVNFAKPEHTAAAQEAMAG